MRCTIALACLLAAASAKSGDRPAHFAAPKLEQGQKAMLSGHKKTLKTKRREAHRMNKVVTKRTSFEDWFVTAPSTVGCSDAEAYFYISDDEFCNQVWRDWDTMCSNNDGDMATECMNEEAFMFDYNLRTNKQTVGRKHIQLAAKNPKTMAKRTQDDWQPTSPSGECINIDAYYYWSGTECDSVWSDWDDWCWWQDDETWWDQCAPVEQAIADSLEAERPSGDCLNWEAYEYWSGTDCDDVWWNWDSACSIWWSDECEAAEIDMYDLLPAAERPSGECLNWDAYYYTSGTDCDDVWYNWDQSCGFWWSEECDAAEEDMWGQWEWEDDYWYDDWVALSKAKPQNNSSGSFKTGFAVGCSAGAIAAMGAFYAFSSRKQTDDFMRA